MKLLDRLQLKDKLLLLGVLPAAILAIILAVYFTSTRLNDIYELVDKTNENLALSIAESSVNGVFSGNTSALNSLLQSNINQPDIISLEITNGAGSTLAKLTSNNATPTLLLEPPKVISTPIKLKILAETDAFYDFLTPKVEKAKDTIIGHIELKLSYRSLQQRQQDILLNSFYITLILLITIGLIARFISLEIGKPILKLAGEVNNITHGRYTPPTTAIQNDNKDEIAILTKGIHEMAHEIFSHQKTLEHKVKAATQELQSQNDKLFSAQEKIIKSAEAKTRFISHISHEIRTPLNGIIGFLEIIQKTQLDNEQKILVNASHLSSKNLQVIINEVLDLAQLEAGKVIVNKVNFQIKQTIQDALLLLFDQARKNGVTLEYQHDNNTPDFINQDSVKFGQVLINLVNNAIKFSPNSTVIISLKAHKPERNHIEICVTDQGIGMSEKGISKLFQEFSQLNDETTAQGTGLGLVITKHILDALNGKITVKSTLGKGSVFCFSIPFGKVKDSYSGLPKTAITDSNYPDLTSKAILVADDNEINRLLLANLLERQNAKVSCVEDGQQAIDISRKKQFDLMLFDLRMPIKMGNEALFEIRHQPNNLNYKTPAVAITAHITSGQEKAHHISSFDGYLIKPIDQSRFFTLIEQLLEEHDYDAKPFVPSKNPSSSITSNKSFDYDIAKSSMNADPAFMLIMLTKFFAELNEQRDNISKCIQQDKNSEAADIVHKIHGSAAYCGTPLLKIIAKQLEVALRKGDSSAIQNSHQKLSDEIEHLLNIKNEIFSALKKPLG